ncbi:MAG: MlaD family protein [Planctomycetota bacterium]
MLRVRRDVVLGLVFFGGLLLLLYATMKLSKASLTRGEMIEVLFDNARGLVEGDQVFILGHKAGTVTRVEHIPGNKDLRIKVTMQLSGELELRGEHDTEEGYKIKISDRALLGGKKVTIDPGHPDQKLVSPGQVRLVGTAPPSPLEALGEFFSSTSTKRNLSRMLDGLANLIDDAKKGKGTIGRLFKEDSLYVEARDLFEEWKKVAQAAQEEQGTIGKLLTTDELHTDLTAFLREWEKVAEGANSSESFIGRALHDKGLGDDFVEIVKDIRSLTSGLDDGQGMLGMALKDVETAQRFNRIMANIDRATEALNEGSGPLASLLHDEETGSHLRKVVADFAAVIDQIRSGEGSIGKLIMEDTLVAKLEKLMDQLSSSVEDVREAAPVQTLFQVFGGTFQ